MLPDTLRGRVWHTTTIVDCDSTHKKLIHFGGLDEYPVDDPDKAHPVAETTIVELGEWNAPRYTTFTRYTLTWQPWQHTNQVIVAVGMGTK